MVSAIVMAAIIAIAATARSETAVAIGATGPMWTDIMVVPSNNVSVVRVLIPSLDSDSCILQAGCSCFAYTGAAVTVVVPPMDQYTTQCITLVSRLEEIASVATFSSLSSDPLTAALGQVRCLQDGYVLLPLVRAQAARLTANATMCFTADDMPQAVSQNHGATAFFILYFVWSMYRVLDTLARE